MRPSPLARIIAGALFWLLLLDHASALKHVKVRGRGTLRRRSAASAPPKKKAKSDAPAQKKPKLSLPLEILAIFEVNAVDAKVGIGSGNDQSVKLNDLKKRIAEARGVDVTDTKAMSQVTKTLKKLVSTGKLAKIGQTQQYSLNGRSLLDGILAVCASATEAKSLPLSELKKQLNILLNSTVNGEIFQRVLQKAELLHAIGAKSEGNTRKYWGVEIVQATSGNLPSRPARTSILDTELWYVNLGHASGHGDDYGSFWFREKEQAVRFVCRCCNNYQDGINLAQSLDYELSHVDKKYLDWRSEDEKNAAKTGASIQMTSTDFKNHLCSELPGDCMSHIYQFLGASGKNDTFPQPRENEHCAQYGELSIGKSIPRKTGSYLSTLLNEEDEDGEPLAPLRVSDEDERLSTELSDETKAAVLNSNCMQFEFALFEGPEAAGDAREAIERTGDFVPFEIE